MGLLNNDNYIDPFKGADYIDPGKNAEKLSSNVDREHAQREAYEQQRYAKQQQTPQRTPTPPQNDTHKKIKNTDNHHRHRSADDHRDEPRRHNRQPRRTGLNSGQT